MTTGSELGEKLLDSVNSGVNPEAVADEVANGHRFLQSEVFKKVLKPVICEFARNAEEGNYDGRNEKVVKECKEIADSMGWYY